MKLDRALIRRILATIEADKDPLVLLIVQDGWSTYEDVQRPKPDATALELAAQRALFRNTLSALQQLRADGLVRDYRHLSASQYPTQQLSWEGHNVLDRLRAGDEGPGV